MIRGSGAVSASAYSQTFNGYDPLFALFESVAAMMHAQWAVFGKQNWR